IALTAFQFGEEESHGTRSQPSLESPFAEPSRKATVPESATAGSAILSDRDGGPAPSPCHHRHAVEVGERNGSALLLLWRGLPLFGAQDPGGRNPCRVRQMESGWYRPRFSGGQSARRGGGSHRLLDGGWDLGVGGRPRRADCSADRADDGVRVGPHHALWQWHRAARAWTRAR